MKSIVILAFFALALFAQAAELLNKTPHEECVKQENLNVEEMTKMAVDGIVENVSKNIKCFHKCMMEKMGIFKDGKLVEERILSDFSKNPEKEKMNGWLIKCKELKAADPCDAAYEYLLCMIAQAKA